MKKNILIFPAGTEIGLEINNALKYSTLLNVYGATSAKDHSEFIYANHIEGIPFITDNTFIDVFNKVIEINSIDFIYPAHDSVLLFLTQNSDAINAKVISTDIKTVEICRSKKKTYEFFKVDPFIPITYNNTNEVINYPVFIKPDVGQGSQGVLLIKCVEELEKEISHNSYVICEYLPGEEFTIDCFTDKYGVLRVVKKRNRARIKTGISVNSKIVHLDEKVLKIANIINSKLTFNGAWFFQLKKNNDGDYKLLEISPRIPGTMGVSRNLGINFALLTIYNTLGYDVDILENNYDIEVDRAFINRYKTNLQYDTIYLDFDDTLLLKEKEVNCFLMMFLYFAVNKNKKIILITKHKSIIEETLYQHKINPQLFDQIIHITKNDKKSDYITNTNSILIDDSFSERKEVKDKHGISVFDLDSVESLIDWRM